MAKAASWTDTDAETRKRGEQTGLDTTKCPPYRRRYGEHPAVSGNPGPARPDRTIPREDI